MATNDPGRLNARVAFDARADADSGDGNHEGDFVQRFARRAGFTFLRGTESVIAARLEGRQPIVVRVRACSQTRQIDAGWRMRDLRNGEWVGSGADAYWSGPAYAVRSVIPSDDRQWIDVTVESGVAP